MRVALPVLIRVVPAVLALAFLTIGVVIVVAVGSAWLGVGWTIIRGSTIDDLKRWNWNERPVVITLATVGVAGLITFAVGAWRRLPLTVGVDGYPGVNVERYGLGQSIRPNSSRLTALPGPKSKQEPRPSSPASKPAGVSRRTTLNGRQNSSFPTVTRYQLRLGSKINLRWRGGEPASLSGPSGHRPHAEAIGHVHAHAPASSGQRSPAVPGIAGWA
jgi:hypothetical protein